MIEDEEEEVQPFSMISDDNMSFQIEESSDEWKRVEFHLKSCVSSEIKITKLINVKNTLSWNQFESLTTNQLWSYGWYNWKGEDYNWKMRQMRTRTFPIPETGVNFRVGAIFDLANSSEIQSVYVLCKIIIGKSFCRLKQENEKEHPPTELENPYESYMYCSPEQSAKSQKMSWSMTKPYSYYIKNKNFIEPLYCVFFTHVDSFITNMQSKYMCSECKIHEAVRYCPDCVNYYCLDCLNNVHFGNATDNKIKTIFQHSESKEIPFTTRPGKCSVHPDHDSEYYCDDCKRAICGYCRFKGSHSNGIQTQHQLEDIYVAFKKLQEQNSMQDYEDKKKNGISTVRKITEQIKTIQQSIAKDQEGIINRYNSNINEMKSLAKTSKFEVFNYITTLREIKRNLVYYQTYFTEREKYLMEQKNYPELAFIWSMHEEIINEFLGNMRDLKKKNIAKSVMDNIKVSKPDINITKETFGFNKAKVLTEMSNKRNIQKNDGFEQTQKDTNYNIVDTTRHLIGQVKKKLREEREKEKEKEIKDKELNNFENKKMNPETPFQDNNSVRTSSHRYEANRNDDSINMMNYWKGSDQGEDSNINQDDDDDDNTTLNTKF